MNLRSRFRCHVRRWVSDGRWGSGRKDNIQKSGVAEHSPYSQGRPRIRPNRPAQNSHELDAAQGASSVSWLMPPKPGRPLIHFPSAPG